jgi:hypothetical protein
MRKAEPNYLPNKYKCQGSKLQFARPSSAKKPTKMPLQDAMNHNTSKLCSPKHGEKQKLKSPTYHQNKRPGTAAAVSRPIALRTGGYVPKLNPAKKNDPVQKHQALKQAWKKQPGIEGKQGRKLELDGFNKWAKMTHKHNASTQSKKTQRVTTTPYGVIPTENRRDDLRFELRAKISQPNYIDKDLKKFHFREESQKGPKSTREKQRLDCLKLQLNQQLKRVLK